MTMTQDHPNAVLLRTLYTDLTRVVDHATDDIIYHLATRDLPDGAPDLHGKQAVLANELQLIEATHGLLVADLEQVIANDYFGVALGTFRIRDTDLAMPICGLWRFRDGLITDHWQNAYDPSLAQHLGTLTAPSA